MESTRRATTTRVAPLGAYATSRGGRATGKPRRNREQQARRERVGRGEVFGAGRHYLDLVASYQPTNVLALQALVINNLGDPSALLLPVV